MADWTVTVRVGRAVNATTFGDRDAARTFYEAERDRVRSAKSWSVTCLIGDRHVVTATNSRRRPAAFGVGYRVRVS